MKLVVKHRTDYNYSASVSQSVNQICLTPRHTDNQTVLNTSMEIEPDPETIQSTLDYYGNSISRFNLDQSHLACTITVTSVVDTADTVPDLPDSVSVAGIKSMLDSHFAKNDLMAHDCLLPSAYVPLIAELESALGDLPGPDTPVLEFAQHLMSWIFTEFEYDPSFSTVVTPITDVLKERKGVCQDYAHLAIAILRYAGVPARYVSGYLETMPPPGQKKLQGSDASHAWYSVYFPGEGWFDFDPTNNKRPDAQYITTAWGRDYADVAPLHGVVFGGGKTKLDVAVDVDRL